jgi:hypothetical protein
MTTISKNTDINTFLPKRRRNPFDAVSTEELDQLSNTEYFALVQTYIKWHNKYWSSSSMYIPQRKTVEERQREKDSDSDFFN